MNIKEGFLSEEIVDLINNLKVDNFNKEKYSEAMFGNTCMIVDERIITYPWDLIKGLRCGIENRDLYLDEWD